jgi:tol-pal system protein YbgF
MAKRWSRAGALILTVVVLASLSQAQQVPPGPGGPPPRPLPPPQAKAPALKEAPPPGSDGSLQRRVEQLEEQLVDLQVVIGTLESLAKGGITPPPPSARGGFGGASDTGRLDAIETQIRALASQMENLQEQLRSLAGRADGFGSVTVAPEAAKEKDEIDRLLTAPPGGGKIAVAPPPAELEAPPQQLYEQAYGYLLQKEFGQAEAGFEDFLKRHPSHQLAGNAQYWLGETFYVRGQYRAAAGAFLKGYQNYAKGPKAPECLLKLAMSLQRLGQKDAACSSFNELATKFPSPPAHVKNIAQAERQRGGC